MWKIFVFNESENCWFLNTYVLAFNSRFDNFCDQRCAGTRFVDPHFCYDCGDQYWAQSPKSHSFYIFNLPWINVCTMLARGFKKFFMEGAYCRCQSFATKVNYFDIFEINFDPEMKKLQKKIRMWKWFEFYPSSKLFWNW